MVNRQRKLLKFILRLAATILIMTALLHFVEFRQVINVLAQTDLNWLLPAYVIVLVRKCVESQQMSLILRYLGYSIGWFRVFRANALAVFYSIFTPGALASVVKWADLTAVTQSGATVFNAILYNRFLLDIQPIVVGALVLLWENPTGDPLLVIAACSIAILALSAAFCLYSPRFSLPVLLKIHQLVSHVSKNIGMSLFKFVQELSDVQAFPVPRHFGLSLIGLAAFLLGICVRIAIMNALGFQVPITTIIWVEATIIATNHIPVTINNFGVREFVAVAAFGLYGVASEQAFAYGLMVYSCTLLIAIIGGIHQLTLAFGLKQARPVRRNRA